MNSAYSFILEYQQQLIAGALGFLCGAALLGVWMYCLGRRQLSRKERDYSALREQMYLTREQLAELKGQYGQVQYQLSGQEQLLKEARVQLGQEFENVANRIFDNKQKQFEQHNQTTLKQSLDPLKQQITDFKQQVADVYQKESAERNQLIGKIGELQQQTQKIGEDALSLALALKGDNKTQGNWGEVVLERLLEESGLQKGREYATQVAMDGDDGKRRNPDVVIYLPENKQLVIDAKVSLIHYHQYVNADDQRQQQRALQAHIASVRQHIRSLSQKNYESLTGLQSLDFVFIFMPVEAAFMLALQTEPALFKEAYDKQIVLVSPTTLMATLRTVANLWRYHKQHKYAEKIAQQAGGLYDQFALVIDALNDVGSQLQKTQQSFDTVHKRLVSGRGNVVKRIEELRHLGAKTKRKLNIDPSNDDTDLPQADTAAGEDNSRIPELDVEKE
ncbi:MAG: DNA recombination protein RmuC [Pseudomonadota bacterium]